MPDNPTGPDAQNAAASPTAEAVSALREASAANQATDDALGTAVEAPASGEQPDATAEQAGDAGDDSQVLADLRELYALPKRGGQPQAGPGAQQQHGGGGQPNQAGPGGPGQQDAKQPARSLFTDDDIRQLADSSVLEPDTLRAIDSKISARLAEMQDQLGRLTGQFDPIAARYHEQRQAEAAEQERTLESFFDGLHAKGFQQFGKTGERDKNQAEIAACHEICGIAGKFMDDFRAAGKKLPLDRALNMAAKLFLEGKDVGQPAAVRAVQDKVVQRSQHRSVPTGTRGAAAGKPAAMSPRQEAVALWKKANSES